MFLVAPFVIAHLGAAALLLAALLLLYWSANEALESGPEAAGARTQLLPVGG